jgi:methyltransferase (TIGR00027 family)
LNNTTGGFGPGQPSRTSIVVAALRAFGAREPDAAVRNPDWLAERLISAAELDRIPEHPISAALREDYGKGRRNREVAGMSNLMLIRTRFIDEHLRRALENGAKQLVILGAGFDTRAYRFADLLKDKRVFEVDYRSTQEIKKQRLAASSIAVPAYVRFAEIDFKKDSLHEVLLAAGYRPAEKSLFIWEGVSMYLSENAVSETLRSISSHSVAGSEVVMDFAGRAMIEMLEKFPQLSQHNYTTHWGEPWTFGLPDGREGEFFRACGLDVREIMPCFGPEARKRYLRRSDGSSFGSIRGGPPRRRKLSTVVRVLWMFLTRRSKWYAVASLTVSGSNIPGLVRGRENT